MRRAARVLGIAGAGAIGVAGSQMVYVYAKFRLPPDAHGPCSGVAASPSSASHLPPLRKNIVFLGDSVVTGVGCTGRDGPTLPRRVAEVVAQALQAEVGWTAIGETGADVSLMQDKFLPPLQQEVARHRGEGDRIDAVVVICGLNDMKACFLHMQPWMHPGSFGLRLRELVASIKQEAGSQCVVLLPAVPLEHAPRFSSVWPLSIFVHGSAAMWEQQKRELGAALSPTEHVAFVEPPGGVSPECFCQDGMHPNDHGYTLWAEHIAARLLELGWIGDAAATPPMLADRQKSC